MDVSISLTCLYVLQEQFSVDGLGKVFVVEDRNSKKYVAVAESVGRSLTALSADEVRKNGTSSGDSCAQPGNAITRHRLRRERSNDLQNTGRGLLEGCLSMVAGRRSRGDL
jgi:hypothetical protein